MGYFHPYIQQVRRTSSRYDKRDSTLSDKSSLLIFVAHFCIYFCSMVSKSISTLRCRSEGHIRMNNLVPSITAVSWFTCSLYRATMDFLSDVYWEFYNHIRYENDRKFINYHLGSVWPFTITKT